MSGGRIGGAGLVAAALAAVCSGVAFCAAPVFAQGGDAGDGSAPSLGTPVQADGNAAADDGSRVQIPSPVLTLDQDRLFTASEYGQRVEREYQTAAKALAEENTRIEAELTKEEKDLTVERPTLSPDAFRKLADAFDRKVQAIRKAQTEKNAELTRRREAERRRFLQIVVPVLGNLVHDLGAVAILNSQAVFLSFKGIDVTDRAIDAVNAKIGDGTQLGPVDVGTDPDAETSGTATDPAPDGDALDVGPKPADPAGKAPADPAQKKAAP
ncbi:OmpH family outer membrane protein [Thioclava sp. BHET1]|nr:OmpH family outer membrane protein [Thioclava sp. BHET1]